MISRDIQPRLNALARQFPAIILTGPRQSGKSTLCKGTFSHLPYRTLESPDVRAFALEDPRGFLSGFPNGGILDEVQNCPELSSYLQELIDEDPRPGRWILTGSQNFALMESTKQSLAGRAAVLHLLPLARAEVARFPNPPETLNEALLAGGYPRIHDQGLKPADWLSSYVATYLERDVRKISNIGDLATFQRFIQLCAGRSGQLLNLSMLAGDCGVSAPTAKQWLSVLEASFIAFRLTAYHDNLISRLIKSPKLHLFDSALACWLLGVRDVGQLDVHPLRGAVFESWAVSEIVKCRLNHGELNGVHFLRSKEGLECDALVVRGNDLIVVEVKAGQTLSSNLATSANRIAEILSRASRKVEVVVVHGGTEGQSRNGVTYLPWHAIQKYRWAD